MPSARAALPTAAPLIPPRPNLVSLRAAAAGCKACDLWKRGTQTVFGEGSKRAVVLFVGEQPGNEEDLSGRPFVGPAGRLLDKALAEAGIDRSRTYVTNVVKHFKWEPRGKKRIHAKPDALEIFACRPWLEAEIAVVQPAVLVCLGATAAQSVLGPQFKLMKQRGKVLSSPPSPGFGEARRSAKRGGGMLSERVVATIHPSAVLRAPDAEGRRAAYAMLVDDLRVAAKLLRRA